MNLVCNKEQFLKAASLSTQVIASRLNLPVLGNLLLEASSGMLKITGTNLETTISLQMGVKIEEEGETTIPARFLIDFCQAATDDRVSIKTIKDSVLLESGAAKATLLTISASEFPKIEKFDIEAELELAKQDFLERVSSVSFCAAAEEGRPVLTGVLIKAESGKLTLVATDGYRLGRNESKSSGNFELLIPARALQEAVKAAIDQEDETIKLAVNKEKNQAKLHTKNLTIFSRLLEGTYPNYEQIIPSSFISTVRVNTKELTDAVKLASLFARDVGNVARIEVDEEKLKLSGTTSQVGDAETEIKADTDGEKMKIAFNSRFLLDVLSALEDKETEISFSGSTNAAIFRGNDNKNLSFVIMPVRPQS